MLGRQALKSLLKSGSAGGGIWRRSFADAPFKASPAAHDEFIAAWKKVAPFTDPPKTPLSFMAARPDIPTSIPTKVIVNFVLPYQTELSAKEGARMIGLFGSEPRDIHIILG